jgi:catechol 2,3-dioxygenase-like lactoylglutathione lyase family enzyme
MMPGGDKGDGLPAGAQLVAFAATTDLERSNAFYEGVLGLTLVETTPFASFYDVGGTPLRITVVGEHARAPYTVLGWDVPDVAAAVARLGALGVAFSRYDGFGQDVAGIWTAPSGARIAWFNDPDGNVLSLSEPPPGP